MISFEVKLPLSISDSTIVTSKSFDSNSDIFFIYKDSLKIIKKNILKK